MAILVLLGGRRIKLLEAVMKLPSVGQRFGQWTVLSSDIVRDVNGAGFIRVQCSCERIYLVMPNKLFIGKSSSCQHCSHKNRGYKFIKGQRCGKWTVLDDTPKKIDKNKANYITCMCECGKIREIPSHDLAKNKAYQCRECDFKYKSPSNQHGYKDVSVIRMRTMERSAKARGFEFNICAEDVWHLYEDQGRRCKLSGLPISFEDHTASVDRIDSSRGYTADNIQLLHKYINYMKRNHPEQYFIELCRLVVAQCGGEQCTQQILDN